MHILPLCVEPMKVHKFICAHLNQFFSGIPRIRRSSVRGRKPGNTKGKIKTVNG